MATTDGKFTEQDRRKLEQFLGDSESMKYRLKRGDLIFLAVLFASGIPLTILVYNLMNLFIGVMLFCVVLVFFIGAVVKRI